MTDQSTTSRILDEVRSVAARQLGRHRDDIDADATFLDLGADSLLLVGMIRELERQVGVRVAMRELFADGDTPRGLSELIVPRIPAGTGPSDQPAPSSVAPAGGPDGPPAPDSTPARPPAITAVAPHPAPAVRPLEPAFASPAASTDHDPSPPRDGATASSDGFATAQAELLARFAERVAGQVRESAKGDTAVSAAQLRMVGELAELMAGQLTPAARSAAPLTPAPARPAPPAEIPAQSAAQPPPPLTTEPAITQPPAAPLPVGPEPIPATTGTARPADTLDFSVYFFGDYPRPQSGESTPDKYALIVDATKFADANGFHAAWLPERHFHSFGGLFPNPSVLAAALARETSRIRLHAGSVVLPLHNTIRVAEEWSVVDNLSGGRAGICIASGWHANDFAFFPDRYGRHRDVMYEQLDELRTLWRGEPLEVTSGSGDPIEIQLHPEPVQQLPPLYAAVVGNPDSYRLAARNDLGIVTNLMTQSIEQLADNIELYRRTRAQAGLDPDAGRVVVLMHTYLGEDLDRAKREAFTPFCEYMRSSLGLLGQTTNSLGMSIDVHNTPEDDLQFLLGKAYERYCQSRALIGTPDSVAAIVDSVRSAGVDEIACFVDFGVDADLVRGALPSLAELRERYATEQPSAPLSFSQERFWLAEQLFPGRNTYNEARAIRLHGELDTTALRTALQRLTERQAALRTVIRERDGEPRQWILPDATVDFTISDHTGGSEDSVVAATMTAESAYRFDLARGPLFRAVLLRFAADRHVLFLNAHHAIIDTVSGYVIARELSVLYRSARSQTTATLPELPISYAEYAHRQREATHTDEAERDIAYWTQQLSGELPVLNLPTDRPRPAILDPLGASLVRHLPDTLSQRIRAFAGRQRTTLFMALLSGFAATVRQLSGQEELVIGAAVADRPEGTENLVGAMLNTLPLRVDATGDPSFAELLHQVRDTAMDAFQHGGTPFEELLKAVNPPRDTSRSPLFQVMVVFENEDVFALDLPGVEATLLDHLPDRAIYDLTIYLANLPQGIRVHAEYNTVLFDAATIDRFLTQFEHLLAAAVSAPDTALSSIDGVPAADRRQLASWQHGPVVPVAELSLGELVSRMADTQPTAIAVESADQRLSYAELISRATALAGVLTAAGVTQGEVVAVRLPRCPGLAVAHLAVLLSHGVCMPIDPSLPAERIRFMIDDSGARLMVTDNGSADAGEITTVHLDETGSATDGAPTAEPPKPVGPEALAYLIYTSGSTGRPKGVLTAHRGMVNTCAWYIQRTTLTPGERSTLTAALGFDVCVLELWSTLIGGATLVIPPHEARHDPGALIEWLGAQSIDVAWLPTSLGEAMLAHPDAVKVCARFITVAGAALRRRPPAGAGFTLLNAYGPTEASILASHTEVTAEGGPVIPIGRPLPNTMLYVLDTHRRIVPIGTAGELYIGGCGLAEGYLNRQELTARRFVTGPVPEQDERLYRTGDLARWNADGELEFLGRNDDQVKIRGFRIEPDEVAHALLRLPEVRDAAVVAQPSEDGRPQLAAFVVAAQPISRAALIERLAAGLPEYMVPRRFAFVTELPRNANGKVDNAALPKATVDTTAGAVPTSARQRELHALWCLELGLESIDTDASFFDLGGDSLGAARLLTKVRSTAAVKYPLIEFFQAPTIAAMAARLGDDQATSDDIAESGSGRSRGSL